MTTTHISYHDRMTVTLPEGEIDGLRVERFEMKPLDLDNAREALHYGRGTKPGWYTRLYDAKTDTLWMSDTDAEKWDHIQAVNAVSVFKAKRVLIQGLGLGMVLGAALTFDHVEHIDVIEFDERVIKLVGPHYADPRVNIIHEDAWQQMHKWPQGTRWDVVWSDIWPDLDTKNIPEMNRMHKFYSRRSEWHRSWSRDTLGILLRRERAEAKREAEWFE